MLKHNIDFAGCNIIGEGVIHDREKQHTSLDWLQIKVMLKHNIDFAGCNIIGEGVIHDREEAARFYRLAADQGNAGAQSILDRDVQ